MAKKFDLGYYCSEGVHSIFTHGFMSFAAVCMIVACLLIMGSFSLVAVNLDNMLGDLEAENEFLAYIDETYTEDQAKALQSQIEAIPNVAEVTFVSRDEALDDFRAGREENPLLSDLDGSVLRDRYRIHVDDIEQLEQTVKQVEQVEGIADTNAAYEIAQDKADLETARQEQQAAKDEQEAAKASLKTQKSEVDALIDQISSQQAEVEKAEAQLRAAADAVDKEIAAAEKELASQISNVVSESGFMWPLPGYNTLSSLFGGRTHPVTGRPNNHTGIDIPAPAGTSILAAKSGVVTTSTYNSSYGNYVVVSHSDGTSTLYAHMSRRGVSKGQTVSQGQVVGYVGTTGSSTGNHLHFEIRVNGSRVDPVNYFLGSMTLYATSGGVKKKL